MTMPEEVNRRVTDLLSDLLFVTSPEGVDNLRHEGVAAERIHFVGNPMIDTLLAQPRPVRRRGGADGATTSTARTRWRRCTARPTSTTRRQAAAARRDAARASPASCRSSLPLHPRGRRRSRRPGLRADDRLRVVDPLGYVDFLSLVRGAALVVTDSGGIQEETTILGVPCLTVRPNTERPDHDQPRHEPARRARGRRWPIARRSSPSGLRRPDETPPLWDGHAGERIADIVIDWLAARAAVPADVAAS